VTLNLSNSLIVATIRLDITPNNDDNFELAKGRPRHPPHKIIRLNLLRKESGYMSIEVAIESTDTINA